MNRKVLWVAALCLLTGAAILLYYPARELYVEAEQHQEIEDYEHRIAEAVRKAKEESGDDFERIYPELYEEIMSYNTAVYTDHQSGLKDAWSYEQSAFELEHYGIEGEIYGVIAIPAMSVELPLYLGASEGNMARGAAVLGQTSIPAGLENSNSVIAAHRGYKGIPMFREIETLSKGDQVIIRTPWDRLHYQVVGTRIIRPDDISAVHIQEGKDMVTLITCHPYPKNTSRYLVYCERVTDNTENPGGSYTTGEDTPDAVGGDGREGTIPEEIIDKKEQGDTWEEWSREEKMGHLQMKLEKWIPLASVPLIILAVILLVLPVRKKVEE